MGYVDTLVNGLMVGGLYGLFGLGLAFAFGVMRIVNVAHGEFIVLSAYIGLVLGQLLPINPILLVVLVALIAFALGWILQSALLNRVMGKDPLPPLLLTFGISIILRNLLVERFGANLRTIDVGSVKLAGFDFAGLRIGVLPTIILAVSVALFVVLHLVLRHTAFGRTLRATADDFVIVQLFGVNYRRIYNIAMGLSVGVSAIAGILLAMRSAFTPFSGVDRILLSFEVVIVGGLGSIWGAMMGGFLLGITHLFGLTFDPDSGLLWPHLMFFLILMVLPSGLSQWRR